MPHDETSKLAALDLLGSWRLVRRELWRDDHCIDPCFRSANTIAYIHYLPDGRMSYITHYRERPQRPEGAPGPRFYEEAYKSFYAYPGRYTREASDRVIHHVELCLNPADIGTDYVRLIGLEGDLMTLSSPPGAMAGTDAQVRLIWGRADDTPAIVCQA